MRKSVATLAAFMLATTLLAACGGGGSAKSEETLPVTSDVGSTADLSTLVANAGRQRYKITYTDQSGVNQTYAQDGKGNSASIAGDSQIFFTKNATITCDKNAGTFECTQSPASTTDAANPLLGVLELEQTQLEALGGNVGIRSTKNIAGRRAQCITFAARDLIGDRGDSTQTIPEALLASKATYAYCIDRNTGVTLEVSGTTDSGRRTMSLEVSKFELPSADDFVPPATPS
jgi:hypothetical protein